MVNSESNYNDHVAKIYSKLSQRAGLLLRTLENRTLDHMRFIWRTYLEPLLDYSSQLYSPANGGSLARLESLLECFSSKVNGLENYDYWDRPKSLKIFSISRRSKGINCYTVWKYSIWKQSIILNSGNSSTADKFQLSRNNFDKFDKFHLTRQVFYCLECNFLIKDE